MAISADNSKKVSSNVSKAGGCIFLLVIALVLFVVVSAINKNLSSGKPKGTVNTSVSVTKNASPKNWVTVITLSGSGKKTSDTFALHGGKARLDYSFAMQDNSIQILEGVIYVMKSGTSLSKDGGFPSVTVNSSGSDTSYLQDGAGNYYLDVSSVNANWTVKVEEEQ